MEALGINLGLVIVQVIAFFIVFLTLNAWVYRPMLNMLESRRQKIAQGLEDARVAAEARADAQKDAEKILANAQLEAGRIVAEATERATAAANNIRTESDAEIEAARQSSLAGVEQERSRILSDMRGQVAALAIAAANKLVGEALDERRQHALLDAFFSGVRAGRVVLLEDAGFKGDAAEITSALPLNSAEEETVRRDVLSRVGASEVKFRVDPSILGGLVIKVGDRVLDGSVAGKLDGLRSSLK